MKGILHVHSEHSLFDSKSNVRDIVEKARKLNADYITLTDHGTLSGIDDFLEACKGNEDKNIKEMKGIPGVEAYVDYDVEGLSLTGCHMILLAKNADGYKDISKAVTKSNASIDSKGRPIMGIKLLQEIFSNKNNTIATTACMGGIINNIFRYNEKLEKNITKLMEKGEEYTSPNDPKYVNLLNEVVSLQEEISHDKEMKNKLKKLANKAYAKKESSLKRKEGTAEYEELLAALQREKEESAKAKDDFDLVEKSIKEKESKLKIVKDNIKKCEKSVAKYLEIEKEINSLQSLKVSDEELIRKAKTAVGYFQDIFGEQNFFVEIQNHGILEEERCMSLSVKLAKEMNVPLVAANDAHMIDNSEEEVKGRQILRSLKYNKFNELIDGDRELYIKSEEELKSSLLEVFDEKIVIEALNNLDRIGEMCNVVFKKEEHFPKYRSSIAGETSEAALRRLVQQGIEWRFPNKKGWTDEYQKRLDYELKIIIDMGYADYHLIVQDFLNVGRIMGRLPKHKLEFLKKEIYNMSLNELLSFLDDNANDIGLSIGPGRGSAAGSLVCYLLGITSIDPMKYDLLFERFLNPERVSMPDIDSDFHPEVRELALEYVKKLFGEKAVCCILTDSTQAAKKAIRNCARILGDEIHQDGSHFYDLGSEICKAIPSKVNSFDQEVNDETCYEFLCNKFKNNKIALRILKEAKIVEGSLVGHGMHAAGVIIADNGDVSDYTPLLWNDNKKQWVCQCNMVHAEEKGLLKMDFLGLKNLKIITDAVRMIKERHGISLDVENLPFKKEVFANIFSKGFTNGVFQVESNGMKQMLKEFKPDSFEDIILLIAAYRPGPMDFIPKIIDVKHGKSKPNYVIPEMETILGVTYGYPIYQEQLMAIFNQFAGFSLGEADTVRRYMSKKKVEKFLEFKPKFIQGLINNGAQEKDAEEFWNQLADFSKYAFNKSHAAAYAFVSYITAYLKHFYPTEYLTAVLNSTKFEKINKFFIDCETCDIQICYPDINISDNEFSVVEDSIYYGLGKIKGIGNAAVAIVEEREKHGDFISFKDFIKRCSFVDKDVLEALIKSGAFDSFTKNRKALWNAKDKLIEIQDVISDATLKIEEGQEILALMEQGKEITAKYKKYKSFKKKEDIIKKVEEAKDKKVLYANKYTETDIPILLTENLKEKLNDEKEYLGAYLSANPLDDYVFGEDITPIANVYETKFIKIAGIITNLRKVNRKSDGAEFAFFKLEDKTGSIDINCFTKTYTEYKNLIEEGNVISISGRIFEEEIEMDVFENPDDESLEESDDTVVETIYKCTASKMTVLKPVKKEIVLFIQNKIDWETNIKPMITPYIEQDGHPLYVIDKLTNQYQKTCYNVKEDILNNPNLSFS